jgi:predicted nucleotidyltransferase/predicted transcriptional regulator with HTH domain
MGSFLQLAKSALRRKTLLFFFTNPDSRLYVREIAKITCVDAGNLSKELLRLERDGLFVSDHRGNQKFYALNRNYPLYNELKSIVFKTIGVVGKLESVLNTIEGIQCAFIYGSFAEGVEHAESDIDLMIIGSPNENALIDELDIQEKEIGREINYNIYPRDEFRRRKTRKDSFITNVLKRKKIMLKGDIGEV